MKKRVLSILLGLVLLVGLLPTAAMAKNTENSPISRADFLMDLAHAAGATGVDTATNFPDVDKAAEYAPYVAWAVKNHIVGGYSDGTFRPNASITREQAAVMTAGYLVSAGYTRGTREDATHVYTDGGKICAWAQTSVAMLARLGVMQGGTDGEFDPDATLTGTQSGMLMTKLTKFLTADRALDEQAKKLCAEMSMDQKIGQLMLIDFRSWKNAGDKSASDMEVLNSEVKGLIQKYHLGGVILFAGNVKNTEKAARLTADLQAAAKAGGDLPLMIPIDQEGGIVTRLGQGTCMPGNMALGATANPQYAYQAAQVMSEELSALGINCNLAPAADVNDNPANPVIGLRSFGSDPVQVSAMARQYFKGLQSTGTIGSTKHFPGHGNTDVDTHTGLALVSRTKEEWFKTEAMPFQTLIASGIDIVMSSHVQYPALDSTKVVSKASGEEVYLPASLSRTMLTDVLRGELGFDGVVSSDAMNMRALTDNFGETQAAVMALQAGSDLLCGPTSLTSLADEGKLEALYGAIRKAVADGTLPQAQLDASVARVIKLKLKSQIIGKEYPTAEEQVKKATAVVGSAEHRATERRIAEAAVTLYGTNKAPMQLKEGETLLVAVPYQNEEASTRFAVERLKKEGSIPNINLEVLCYLKAETLSEEQTAKIKEADHVVVISELSASVSNQPEHWINAIPQLILAAAKESGKTDSAVVSVGLPYDAVNFADVPVYQTYGYIGMSADDAASGIITSKYGPNIVAGIGCALGTFAPTGKLPVALQ